ncbi:MAG: hypothetical protein ACKVU2_02515 [Saprospiraceae bacterium]
MIAYDQTQLDALLTRDTAAEWHEQGLISDEKWMAVQIAHPPYFYKPNVFIRIGLAIFAMIMIQAAIGMLALILSPDSEVGMAFFCFFSGALTLVALEMLAIGKARHYGSGVDDMLLYATATALLGGVFAFLLPGNAEPLVYCCIALPVLVAGSIRYLDRLMAIGVFVCSLSIVLLIAIKIPRLALYILPFTSMLFAAGVYFFARKGQMRHTWRHFHGSLAVLELLAIVLFYLSGNFWMIQQAAAGTFGLDHVPLPWFFWTFTFAVPAAYIFWGLRQKDRLLLDVGLGCVAVAVFTFRYYFHVMPLAWAAVIGGVILFATAYFSIRHLKKRSSAYTYEADTDKTLLQEIEQQLIAQNLTGQTPTPSDEQASLGGGQFGGGGADGQF